MRVLVQRSAAARFAHSARKRVKREAGVTLSSLVSPFRLAWRRLGARSAKNKMSSSATPRANSCAKRGERRRKRAHAAFKRLCWFTPLLG